MENALGPLPLGFQDWPPICQAALLGLLTFVQEDAPTVGAALLTADGQILWAAGFFGCFLGIWIGDGLLYLAARGAGRPLLQTRLARRWLRADAVARSEAWFRRRGGWALWACRFLPGTRLPTFLAAGFLGVPWPRFFAITGLAALIWTLGVFSIASLLGPSLHQWLQRFGLGLGALLILGLAILWLPRQARRLKWRRAAALGNMVLARWRRWEFWPAPVFYAPVLLRYCQLAIRYRSLTLPTAANPGIFAGGVVGESKIEILQTLMLQEPTATAHAWVVSGHSAQERLQSFQSIRLANQLPWPCVLKPDVGQRGKGVKVIQSDAEAMAYFVGTDARLLLQAYAEGPREAGIFYCRLPGESSGRIWSVTDKEFPQLTGDGHHTLEELIWRHPRARYQARTYLRRFAAQSNRVLDEGETLPLVQAGNHAQGCIFHDGRHLITAALESRIDAISRSIGGFFIGRYDIRYTSEEDLRHGRNFQIVELNGATAEATSIYDPTNSLRAAYRTLFRQWELVFQIGAANRARGHLPTGIRTLWRAWSNASRQWYSLPLAD